MILIYVGKLKVLLKNLVKKYILQNLKFFKNILKFQVI